MCNHIPEICHLTYKYQLSCYLGENSLRARRLRYQITSIFKIYKGFIKLPIAFFHRSCDYSLLERTDAGEYIDVPLVTSLKVRLVLFFDKIGSLFDNVC